MSRLTNESGLGVTGLTKEGVKGLATSVFSSCKELVFTTVSVNGSLEFTAWEWVSFSSLSSLVVQADFTTAEFSSKMTLGL